MPFKGPIKLLSYISELTTPPTIRHWKKLATGLVTRPIRLMSHGNFKEKKHVAMLDLKLNGQRVVTKYWPFHNSPATGHCACVRGPKGRSGRRLSRAEAEGG